MTVTRILSYAKASELVTPLKRFLSARGDVMAIDRSNTLIIRDIPDSMPQVDNLIRQLDRKSQQVEIQARVVQASRTFARDIGTQFGIAGVNHDAEQRKCPRRQSDRDERQPDRAHAGSSHRRGHSACCRFHVHRLDSVDVELPGEWRRPAA